MTEITFTSNRYWLNEESPSRPTPAIKTIPQWYREADRFAKNPESGEHIVGHDGGKVPTFKACPAMFDVMTAGYALVTPSDVEFFFNHELGHIDARVLDPNCQDFIQSRPPMPQFISPAGYESHHFAWWADWGITLPQGYSALYVSPVNRFELPFFTVGGTIDNDVVNLLGLMPFFVRKGFEGVVPAGTPYAQIIPFKREDWTSSVVIEKPQEIYKKNVVNSQKYRVPDGGVYMKQDWHRRKYD